MNKQVLLSIIFFLMVTGCNEIKQVANQRDYLHQAIIDETIEIETKDLSLSKQDLANFAKKLKDVRIVALGEQTHGAGSVFTLKTQLIEYLHNYHDFDVLILESGMYDVEEIWQQAKKGQRIKDIAPGNIFYMYSKTDEVTPLFDYINAQASTKKPLRLVGFDSQHTGGISNKNLIGALTKAVSNSADNWINDKAWPLFTSQLQRVLNVDNTRLSPEEEKRFFKQIDQLKTTFSANQKHAFWYRITRGLEAQAKRQWQISDARSQEMGENIKYWAEKYPDKKMIVWAHSFHLMNQGLGQINAGQVAKEAFGKDYYMIHFTGASGDFLNFINMENTKVATPSNNSFEKLLNDNISSNIAFNDIRSLKQHNVTIKDKTTSVFANNYQQTVDIEQWTGFWDGLFFIKEIKPAHFKE
ncbi:erythromycin esterase family protein [Colwelliaceae bacterium 6441]